MNIRRVERGEDERGATIVLLALLMVALLTLAAIVVDLGGVRQKRRQAQGSADASSLGAAQLLSSSNPFTDATNEAKSLALNNFGIPASFWNSCNDPDIPAGYSKPPSETGNCISFDNLSNPTRIRVYIPHTYQTAFGGVVGVKAVKTSGSAIAQLGASGAGAVLPFGVGSASQGYICLKEPPPGGATPPCVGAAAGNFRYLDVAQNGSSAMGTTPRCQTGTVDARLLDNIAMGIDHRLSVWVAADVLDAAAYSPNAQCASNFTFAPNTIDTQTGMTANKFTTAMVTDPKGTSGGATDQNGGRLQRGSYATRTILGVALDDKPLWEFISASVDHLEVPDICERSTFETLKTTFSGTPQFADQMRTALVNCINAYNATTGPPVAGCSHKPCDGVLFDANTSTTDDPELVDIQYSARFGYAPVVCADSPPSGNCVNTFPTGGSDNVRVTDIVPVFLQRLQGNRVDFEPGVNSAAGSGNADSITAFVLPRRSLPRALGDPDAPFTFGKNLFVTLVR